MKRCRRVMCVLLCTCLAMVTLLALPQAVLAIPSFEEAVIIASGVNMRMRPTAESPQILQLENGTRVGVFCEEVDGWYRIIYGNYRGYVSKEFVFLPSTDVLVGNVVSDDTPVYMSGVDVSERIDTVNAGVGLTVTSMQGDYYGVEYAADGAIVPGQGETEPQPEAAVQGEPVTGETVLPEEEPPTEEILADSTNVLEGMKRGYIKKEDINISASKNASNMIKEGMQGVEVVKMQRELRDRGFLGDSATGEFGSQTKRAVTLFQEFAGLDADGIAGAKTLEMLYDPDNDIRCTYAQRMGISGEVKLTPWDEMDSIFPRDSTAKVTDALTGISWTEERFGGWFHADCQPLTAEDTAKMKEAVGGEWTWDRRAIWVTIDGVTYAASMNCMPHMVNPNEDNNFDGHHCIHFYKSKVHETSAECPRHQAKVQFAYQQGNS